MYINTLYIRPQFQLCLILRGPTSRIEHHPSSFRLYIQSIHILSFDTQDYIEKCNYSPKSAAAISFIRPCDLASTYQIISPSMLAWPLHRRSASNPGVYIPHPAPGTPGYDGEQDSHANMMSSTATLFKVRNPVSIIPTVWPLLTYVSADHLHPSDNLPHAVPSRLIPPGADVETVPQPVQPIPPTGPDHDAYLERAGASARGAGSGGGEVAPALGLANRLRSAAGCVREGRDERFRRRRRRRTIYCRRCRESQARSALA